jgi:hypothetical protein
VYRRDAIDVATTTVGLTDLKFRLVREDFADAVAWVARNLPTRPTVPVLAGVLLTGSDDGLTISGFDYEVSAEVQVAAEIASPWKRFGYPAGCCRTSPGRSQPNPWTSASKAPGRR